MALYDQQRYAEAIDCFDTAIKYNYQDHIAYSNKGLALSKEKRYAEAFYCFDEAIALDPLNGVIHLEKRYTRLAR